MAKNKNIDMELEEKPPVIFIELCDQQDSGFIQEDTQGLPTQIQLRAPTVRFIPTEGRRRGVKIDEKTGKKIYYNERIRHIKNEPLISYEEQRKLNIEPSPEKREDLIPIEKGYATIVREGASVGLFDYLMEVFYNESNPHRSPKATKIFRVLEIDKQAEEINEQEMIAADAVSYIGTLYEKLGTNQYKYKENKIDAICEMFAIVAETMPTKTYAILQFAKKFPKEFLLKVTKLEQTTITEVLHGLELGVIKIEGNMVQYAHKDKIIKSLGTQPMARDRQIEALADYFRTPDGNAAYTEYRAELEAAKENTSKN